MFGNHARADRNPLRLTYDEAADAVYVYFTRMDVERTEEVGPNVNVDYSSDGEPVGVEFLDVSDGIELDDVPRRDDVERLLEERHFRVFA